MKRFASQAFYMAPDDASTGSGDAAASAAPTPENNAIKAMREQLNVVLAEKKASDERAVKAEALITESERAKLADNERLQLERDDARKRIDELSPLTLRTEQLEAKFTALYEAKILALPADKQEQARNLSGVAQTPEARFDMLLNLEPLLVPVIVPKQGGTPTGIGAVGAVQHQQQAPATLDPKDWGSIPMHKAIQEVANDPDRASKLRFDLPKTPAQ